MPKHPFDLSEKLLLGCALLVSLLFGGVGFVSQQLDVEPEWEELTQPGLPEPNAYDLYRNAVKSYVAGQPKVNLYSDATWDQFRTEMPEPKLKARLHQWVRANAPVFAIIRQSEPYEFMDPRQIDPGRIYSYDNSIYKLSSFEAIAARSRLMENDAAGCFGHFLEAFRMAEKMTRGGNLRSVQLAMFATASKVDSKTMRVCLDRLSAAEAQFYTGQLTQLLNGRWTFRQIYEVERNYQLRKLKLDLQSPTWREKPFVDPDKVDWQRRLRFQLMSKRKVEAEMAKFYNENLKASGLPFARAVFADATPSDNLYLAQYWDWSIKGEYQMYTAWEAGLRMLRYRLLLQNYAQTHGHYPNSLQELNVPGLSQNLDPFAPSPQPFGYRRQYHGYLIWSVGPDGKGRGDGALLNTYASQRGTIATGGDISAPAKKAPSSGGLPHPPH